jgi:hypothetical protein
MTGRSIMFRELGIIAIRSNVCYGAVILMSIRKQAFLDNLVRSNASEKRSTDSQVLSQTTAPSGMETCLRLSSILCPIFS